VLSLSDELDMGKVPGFSRLEPNSASLPFLLPHLSGSGNDRHVLVLFARLNKV